VLEFGPHESQFKLIESKDNIFVLSEYTKKGKDSLILRSTDDRMNLDFGKKFSGSCFADWSFEKGLLKIIYTTWTNNRWRLVECDIKGDEILTEKIIFSKIHSFKSKFLIHNNQLILVQTQSDLKNQSISCKKKIKNKWQKQSFLLSDINKFSSRPEITALNDAFLVVWDAYGRKDYHIWGRIYNGEWSDIFKISNNKGWNLKPTCAVYDKDNFIVVWINRLDVTSAEGIIDQKHSIYGAILNKNGEVKNMEWLADLNHGILAKLKPVPEGVWGYLGRRRYPLIKTDKNSSAYILWERKLKRDEGTTKALGELCALPIVRGQKSKPISIHKGMLFYDTDSKKKIQDNKFNAGALKGGLGKERKFFAFEINLGCKYPYLKYEKYDEWEEISLPLKEDRNYKKENLFWGDIHTHTQNSADAEGKLDEIYHYARDKALLDFVAVTDNDSCYLDMKESEWLFDKFYADFFNEKGKFVALYGFEWSSADDRGKVNHRSVLMDEAPDNIPRWTLIGAEIENLTKIAEEKKWILHPHHQTWRLSKSFSEKNIETTSGWGIYIERGKNIFQTLNKGFRGGLIGGSDSHRRNPGLCGALTALFAKKLTRSDISEALRKSRCYATNGSRIIIDYFSLKKNPFNYPTFNIGIISPERINSIVIIRNGKIVFSKDAAAKRISFSWKEDSIKKGNYWYILKVTINRFNTPYPSNLAIAKGGLAWAGPIKYEVFF